MSPEDLVTLIAQEFADASTEDVDASAFRGNAQYILAALVDAVGLSWEMVEWISPTPMLCDDPTCEGCNAPDGKAARAIALILRAAGKEQT